MKPVKQICSKSKTKCLPQNKGHLQDQSVCLKTKVPFARQSVYLKTKVLFARQSVCLLSRKNTDQLYAFVVVSFDASVSQRGKN